MRPTLLSLLCLYGMPAVADEVEPYDTESNPSVVFILPPHPNDPERSDLGIALVDSLESQIAIWDTLRVVPLDAIGMIQDISATLYARSCPEDEVLACSYVLGVRGGAHYAVATQLELLEHGVQISVHLIDVYEAESAVAFQLVLEEDRIDAYGQTVARILDSLATGRLAEEDDIRDIQLTDREAELLFNDNAAQALQQLSGEIGDVSTLSQRRHGRVEREEITRDDLILQAQTDGLSPWERLDMSANEYVRYYNSGLNLIRWRELVRGRKGQLVLRPQVGIGRTWADSSYYGHVVSSEESLQTLESWAWQVPQLRDGFVSTLSVGVGVRPELEVGLIGGVALGSMLVQIDRTVENQSTTIGNPFEYARQNWSAGGYFRVSALPDWLIRPSLTGGIIWWMGTRISDHDLNLPPVELPDLDPARFFVTMVSPGTELRLSDTIDLVAEFPFYLRTGGVTSREEWNGLDTGLILEPVPNVALIGYAVQVGMQVRLFGGRTSNAGLGELTE